MKKKDAILADCQFESELVRRSMVSRELIS